MSAHLPHIKRAELFALLSQWRAILDDAKAIHGDRWPTLSSDQRIAIDSETQRRQKPLERRIDRLRAEIEMERSLNTLALLIRRAAP